MANIVIKYSSKWRGIYRYSAIVFIAIAFILGIHLVLTDSTLRSPQGVALAWFTVASFILLLSNRVSVLIIQDSGLKVGWPSFTIPWERIESVTIRSFLFQQMLMIKFSNATKFRQQKHIYMFWKVAFWWFDLDHDFSINISFLELPPEEILSIVKGKILRKNESNS